MDSLELEKLLVEEIKSFEDLKTQIQDLQLKIGALTEQQRAVYNLGLEKKGTIDALMKIKAKDADKLKNSKTAGLTLPIGVNPVPAPPVTSGVVAPEPVEPIPAAQVPSDPVLEAAKVEAIKSVTQETPAIPLEVI